MRYATRDFSNINYKDPYTIIKKEETKQPAQEPKEKSKGGRKKYGDYKVNVILDNVTIGQLRRYCKDLTQPVSSTVRALIVAELIAKRYRLAGGVKED